MKNLKSPALAALVCPLMAVLSLPAPIMGAQTTSVTVQAGQPGRPISPDLFGIFFEDINYAADGGLYAELVQNRSFEYTARDNRQWNNLTAWELVQREGAQGRVTVETVAPLHANNPRYAALEIEPAGGSLGLLNAGFDGIPVKAGEAYDFSLFARAFSGTPGPIRVRLESKQGALLGEAGLAKPTTEWQRFTATLKATADDADARLVVLVSGAGKVGLDMISLFPQKTFRHRPNGLRADLAQIIADLKPKFMRFPGGCLAHGDGLGNMYRWKNTIGPVERRKAQPNIWRYHQTAGLGYFEYFQFCEDIGAKPLPVVPAGVCCQNSHGKAGRGQEGLPLSEMPEYVQEVLDLIEYANGPAASPWGAQRAAAGHPAPFKLEYLGVGNEDHITPVFRERFKMIHDAVKARHPEITVIGTSGPFHSGPDFDAGWQFANELRVDMVDEHYYESPQWFLGNLRRYDAYDRAKSKVYLGEYASRGNTLYNALAEAAYLTHLERNGDVVRLASYAPLLGKARRTQWNPNLIYFDNTTITPTVNYYVQQLFSCHQGDEYLAATVSGTQTAGVPPEGLLLGTWNTQAEFDEVRLVSGAGTTLFEESFEKGSGRWEAAAGAWSAVNGVYRQTANDEPALSRIPVVAGQSNATLTVRARKTGGAEGFLIGFRAVDAATWYWWNLGGWGNSRHAVEKSVHGAKQTVSRSVPGRIEPNRWYDIKIEMAGPRIRCHLDGQLIHEFSDAGLRGPPALAVSAVRDTRTGDLILKLVNVEPTAKPLAVTLAGIERVMPAATKTVLTGDPKAVNSIGSPARVTPETSSCAVGKTFDYQAPPHSLTVIRLKTR